MNMNDTLITTGAALMEIQKRLKATQTKILLLCSDKLKTQKERDDTLIDVLEDAMLMRFVARNSLAEIEAHCKTIMQKKEKKAKRKSDHGNAGIPNPTPPTGTATPRSGN